MTINHQNHEQEEYVVAHGCHRTGVMTSVLAHGTPRNPEPRNILKQPRYLLGKIF